MKIEKINVYKICLPFTGDFSISRLKGLFSTTIVVEAVAEHEEMKGYGEGIPVEFVTGETPESVVRDVRAFALHGSFPWGLSNISQIWNLVDDLPNGKGHNAAICAIEMALLDVLGRSQNTSIIEYFPKDFRSDKVFYGASIPLGNKGRVREICKIIRKMGISHLRIKLGIDFEQNRNAIETVGSVFGDDCELRIDPNGVWNRDLAFKHLPLIREHNVKIVEEPMPRESPGFVEFAETMQANGVTLMACESAPTLDDVERIIQERYYQMINVKLCRSGGFRRSLRMIERVRKSGLSFQIGCTLGESGILSAAGRVLSLLCGDAVYYDGSYDRFVLKENTTVQDVSFGRGGEAGPLVGPGLGVRASRERLLRLSGGCPTVTISNPL